MSSRLLTTALITVAAQPTAAAASDTAAELTLLRPRSSPKCPSACASYHAGATAASPLVCQYQGKAR